MVPLKEHRGRRTGPTPITDITAVVQNTVKFEKEPEQITGVDRTSTAYKRARAGFQYWQGTNDNYTPKNPVKTRYSFGDRFNAGRLGVKCDRAYTAGGTNYHYWSSVESKMTPIGRV